MAWRRVLNLCPCRRCTFNDPNSVSLQALWQNPKSAQQLPQRLIDAVIPCAVSTSRKSLLAYWLPLSLCKISLACLLGWRLNHTMRSASMTMSRVMSWRRLQPITCRLNRSMTTARNSHPSSVAM
jgi:hypothetical protein